MRRGRAAPWGVLTWAVTLGEYAMLLAWKGFDIPGTGNVLVAWIVFMGLCGIGFAGAPPRRALGWRGFGWSVVAGLNVGMAVALFWFGHGLLGVLWLAWLIGGFVFDARCRALCKGRSHG